MRILIVNIYFHPDPTGTGWVITELARDLAAQGHDITVITSVPHYGLPSGDKRQETKDERRETMVRKGLFRSPRPSPFVFRLWNEAIMDGLRVIRTAVYVPRQKTFWTRVLNYSTFSALAIAAGLRSGPQDVILCTSPPLSIGVSAWLLGRLKRIPFVFNVQDIYPDAAVLMGMVRNPTFIAILRALELFVYHRASLITVISGGARDNLIAKGVPDSRISVIPNWVDTREICPGPAENDFRRRLGLMNRRTVMFAGNIGLIAGLETVLDAAAALRHRPDIQFLIVGEGNAKAALVARAGEMHLRNVTFLPTQPREILSQVLAAADMHLVTLKRRMSTTSVPSKSYGIMASGRPMVAAVDPGSEIWRLVEAADAGICVPPEEPAALAKAIEELCDSPERRRAMGEKASAYVARHHAKEALTALYGASLESVAKKAGGRDSEERAQGGSGVRTEPSGLTPDP